MLERKISAQFYCSVLNGVFSEHCSFTLKYDSSFCHLESHGNSVSRCATPRFIQNSQNTVLKYSIDLQHVQNTRSSKEIRPISTTVTAGLLKSDCTECNKKIRHYSCRKVMKSKVSHKFTCLPTCSWKAATAHLRTFISLSNKAATTRPLKSTSYPKTYGMISD